MPEEDAKQYAEQMAKPDLVFLTKENEGKVKRITDQAAVDNLDSLRCKSCASIISGPHDCPGPFTDADADG